MQASDGEEVEVKEEEREVNDTQILETLNADDDQPVAREFIPDMNNL